MKQKFIAVYFNFKIQIGIANTKSNQPKRI